MFGVVSCSTISDKAIHQSLHNQQKTPAALGKEVIFPPVEEATAATQEAASRSSTAVDF
ncbi:hypothetical protein J6590_077059 [Homalodisca vitripennis]|nr:hypothetical protein J6590_077059 [Homalodisca vitripennis]